MFQICVGKTFLGSTQDDKGGLSPKVLLLMKLALGIGPLTTSLGMWVDLGGLCSLHCGPCSLVPTSALGLGLTEYAWITLPQALDGAESGCDQGCCQADSNGSTPRVQGELS